MGDLAKLKDFGALSEVRIATNYQSGEY